MAKSKLQKLKEKADKTFSLYIRKKYADWKDFVTCYTCGKVAHYKEGMQNGHFISRASNKLRYDERNCRVQCYGCNVCKNGNYIEYMRRMIKEVGLKEVDKLRKEGKETRRFTEKELQEIIDKYKTND